MKFNYLKLTLLAASFAMAPAFMQAEPDVEAVVLELVHYLDPNGPQHTMPETIAMIDKALVALQGKAEYQEVCMALQETKNILVQFNIAQAQGVLGRVTSQLEAMYTSLSEGTRNVVNARLEQLKNLNILQKGKFMSKLGIALPKFGRK